MSSIRDIIVRVGRSARQIESFTSPKVDRSGPRSPFEPQNSRIKPQKDITKKHQKLPPVQYRGYLSKYQNQVFRDFLEPLEIPNLKTFNDNLPQYDQNQARSNWIRKSKSQGVDVFVLQDRILFGKMMDELVRNTPEKLKGSFSVSAMSKNHLLGQQENETNQFPGLWPANWYGEVPPMPQPLTKQAFQQYIYILTHSKFHYKNSQSLTSGIIPRILLYTHKLTNDEFKQFRSVHTYNYLIKFFGCDKHQSSFARELLLVMNKDGHKPNIDTINNLLKLCKIHSRIRSNTNTYQIVMKYLKLCQTMGIEINLSTYNRVYDSINNVFLKEVFLNKIQQMELPISKNLMIKILDDFAYTTNDTSELIKFITHDLGQENWHNDSKLLNKVISHRCVNINPLTNGEDNGELEKLWKFVGETENVTPDEYTVKSIIESIRKNKHIKTHKAYLMVSMYVNLIDRVERNDGNPRVYREMIRTIVEEMDVCEAAFMVRGIIDEASRKLELSEETEAYENGKHSLPENYKIIRRIVGDKMDVLEAQIEHHRSNNRTSKEIKPLHVKLSSEELDEWNSIKASLMFSVEHKLVAIPERAEIFAPKTHQTRDFPADLVEKYLKSQARKYQGARVRKQMAQMSGGFHRSVRREMAERKIYPDPSQPIE